MSKLKQIEPHVGGGRLEQIAPQQRRARSHTGRLLGVASKSSEISNEKRENRDGCNI